MTTGEPAPTSVGHGQLLAYLDVLNARLSAVNHPQQRIAELHGEAVDESSSVAVPFRGTAGALGGAYDKMLAAARDYVQQTEQIRDSLQGFLKSAGLIDDEHGAKVGEHDVNEQIWTI
ncbi:hypothetical protein ACNUDN_30225 [Mycobacterium sp. smrl_JER01]|uniref:hypothetical protein n=1 Tax=Mycobacterium sp. smrl_JER01 TaxID=3402633 RepID=UPI003AD7542D